MKIRHSTTPLPRCWQDHPQAKGIVAEGDLYVCRGSRISAKLLVFDTVKNLNSFWRDCLGKGSLGNGCPGAVNSLGVETWFFPGKGKKYGKKDGFKTTLEVDPRYFCLIGLTKDNLTMEIITHEAGHAAFAYCARMKGRHKWPHTEENEEEDFCYPLGRIASAINSFCRKRGLFD